MLKTKIMEFINLVDSTSAKPEDIKKIIGEEEEDASLLNEWPELDNSSWAGSFEDPQDPEQLNALRNGKCRMCDGWGHFSAECPNHALKGKGKGGKGKGKDSGAKAPKGGKTKGAGKTGGGKAASQGKGKGPAAGCWECGGPHYAADCPNKGKAKGSAKSLVETSPQVQT